MPKAIRVGFTKGKTRGQSKGISGFDAIATTFEVFGKEMLSKNAAYTAFSTGKAFIDLVADSIINETFGSEYPKLNEREDGVGTVARKLAGRGSTRTPVSQEIAEKPWVETGQFVNNALGFYDGAGNEVKREEVISWLQKKRTGNVQIGVGVPLDKVRLTSDNQLESYSDLAYILEYGAQDIPPRPVFSLTLRSDKLKEALGLIRTHSLKSMLMTWEKLNGYRASQYISEAKNVARVIGSKVAPNSGLSEELIASTKALELEATKVYNAKLKRFQGMGLPPSLARRIASSEVLAGR